MPKKHAEIVIKPRHHSRRAASKEALKQMQILLDDEDDDTVEIRDDDLSNNKHLTKKKLQVIPVSVSPPKKKYKLSHRKSADDRDVIVLKTITPSITNHYVENNLELECWTEDLEPCQKARNKQIQDEEKEMKKRLEELMKSSHAEVIFKGDLTTAVEVKDSVQKALTSAASQPNIILNNAVANPGQSYQLVMDPRLGLIVGAMPTNAGPASGKQIGKVQVASNLQSPAPVSQPGRRGRKRGPAAPPPPTPPPPPAPTPRTTAASKRTPVAPPPAPPATRGGTRPSSYSNARPTETNVEGGLSTGSNSGKTKGVVDLTDDGKPLPDSREISFNKLQGKTFPSLVVVARPHLRVMDVNADRPKLDAKVKSVLMHAPTKFTEWLIQQGLVRSEQRCSIHSNTQLKLGMYSDVSKFPYSGGYVWISECCPSRFVSVFSGSLFEGSPHPPLVILKLLYHWACQTNIQNVTQWVKVDNLYVKGMYTWLRSVCTVALQTHIRQLGGPNSKVEVGVISLGTTSQDGNSRQVKVEVLGILETASKLIRLRAVEPLADGDRNYKKRFSKILEPLVQWVHPASIIVTDLTVDKATLLQMGFVHVVQSTSSDASNSNRTIMEYLRRIVPRMFQNTLSLLSRQIIQQFLDELVWREWFGTTSLQAFDNLVVHLSEQTRFEANQSLIVRLNRVALNPFKNWAIPSSTPPPSKAVENNTSCSGPSSAKKRNKRKEPEPQKAPPPAPSAPVEVSRPPKSTSPDVPEQMVPLENYYYGTIDNYPPKTNIILNMKCPFCKESFNNNIVLMNHLFKHAHNVSKDGQMCRYCLTSVPTANDLLKHIATSHPAETKFDNGFVCLVCETQYMNPFVLGKHMSKEHCPSELPYQCGTCGYRCSNHKQAIDHFYKQHDNGPTIQCPFCLKSTTVFSSSRNIVQNMNYFIQHLQKHQRKQFARRCGKCNLWFVQKDVLKDHQIKMHVSQRGKRGLLPWTAPRNGVMVPKSKMDKYPCDADGINFGTLFFKVSKNLLCKECELPLDTAKHFPSFESCQNPNCQYSTCCTNAMQEHNARCSKNPNPTVAEEKLPYEMFCVCGFKSIDGNQMAKHLAICERKSAYPSFSESKTASVTHSMLDVLGLVRKPGENERKMIRTKPDPEAIEIDDDDDDAPLVKLQKHNFSKLKPKSKRKPAEDIANVIRDADREKAKEKTSQSDKVVTSQSDKVVLLTEEPETTEKQDSAEKSEEQKTTPEVEKMEDKPKNAVENPDENVADITDKSAEDTEDAVKESVDANSFQPENLDETDKAKSPKSVEPQDQSDEIEPPKSVEPETHVDEDDASKSAGPESPKSVEAENDNPKSVQAGTEGPVETENEDLKSVEAETQRAKSVADDTESPRSVEGASPKSVEGTSPKSVEVEPASPKSVEVEPASPKSVEAASPSEGFKSVEPEDEDPKSVEPQDEDLKSVEPEDEDRKSVEPEDEDLKSVEPEDEGPKLVKPESVKSGEVLDEADEDTKERTQSDSVEPEAEESFDTPAATEDDPSEAEDQVKSPTVEEGLERESSPVQEETEENFKAAVDEVSTHEDGFSENEEEETETNLNQIIEDKISYLTNTEPQEEPVLKSADVKIVNNDTEVEPMDAEEFSLPPPLNNSESIDGLGYNVSPMETD